MSSNKELRKTARTQLVSLFDGNWMTIVLVVLIVGGITGGVSAIPFVGIASLVLVGPLSYGASRVCAKFARNNGQERPNIGDTFKGFSENIGENIVLGLLSSLFIFLWMLLLIVPGIIKSYSYAMCYYIQQDATEKDWKTSLDTSKQWMKGNKWKLFCLDLSFIGWYIVGLLCLGVGMLWVNAYHEQARANFYLELKAEHENQ